MISCFRKLVSCLSHPLVLFSLALFLTVGQSKERVRFQDGKSENPVSSRDPKLMYYPFIKVVIPPEPCGELTNGVRSGVCLPLGKCGKVGGNAGGTCSYGFGECCTISTNCTAERRVVDVNQYVTVLTPPVADPTSSCSFRLKKQPDVCQVRLDFRNFRTTSADSNGDCIRDRLMISNSITVPDGFTTCGDLTQQHMYLTFGSSESIDLTPILTQAGSQYSIVVSQIPCYSKRVVPSHCLQYFNTTTARVRSFDFGFQQQSKQRYTICVEATERSREIMWKPCASTDKPFVISAAETPDPSCLYDWIQINGEIKRCGNKFPTKVSSPWKPYTINVNFDNNEIPQLPFPPVPSNVATEADCTQVQANSGGLLACFYDTGSCTCQYTINIQPLFGFPDVNNTGFCLEYQL